MQNDQELGQRLAEIEEYLLSLEPREAHRQHRCFVERQKVQVQRGIIEEMQDESELESGSILKAEICCNGFGLIEAHEGIVDLLIGLGEGIRSMSPGRFEKREADLIAHLEQIEMLIKDVRRVDLWIPYISW